MNISKYLIILVHAVAVTACQQNKAPKAADTVTKSDTISITDTIKTTYTTTVDMPGDKPVPLAQLIVPGICVGQTASA